MSAIDDVRYATRFTLRRPGRAVLASVILAMGIGTATAVFTVVDKTVLRRPPFKNGDRLVDVMNIRRGGGGGSGHSAEKLLAWREQPSVFERLEGFVPRTFDLTSGLSEPERISALAVSPGLFEMLGVQPVLGRAFVAGDAIPGADRLLIVSERLAERRLGGSHAALGASLLVGGQPYSVIGVMPDAFTLLGREQAWVPIDPRHHLGRPGASFFALGRLVAGLTIPHAQLRANEIADRLQAEAPIARTWDIRIDEKRVATTNPAARSALLALLGGVACLLLLACVSVMQLVLSSTSDQRHELMIRASLGATRLSLIRQVLIQVAIVVLSGAVLGILAAIWAVRVVAASSLSLLAFWRTAPLTVDGRVLAVAVAATVVAVGAAGLLPALWATRAASQHARNHRGAATLPSGTERLSTVLVAAQVACAVLLAAGAGLMFRTIANVSTIPLGLDPDGVIAMNVNVPVARYPTEASQFEFFARVLEQLRQTPGVSAAAVAGGLTFHGFGDEKLASAGGPGLPDDATLAMNSVSDGYFEALRVKVVAGRTFTRHDMGSNVAVIGRTLASRLWPHGDAVGATLRSGDDGRAWTVIGVVDDLDDRPRHDRPIQLQWYLPRSTSTEPPAFAQGTATHRLIVRAASLEVGLAAAKAAVWAENPDQPIERVIRARDELQDVFAAHFLVQRLATVLSAIGLLVACVGVFGVLAQAVARRRREIGVRMALGATPKRIGGMVIVRAGSTVAVGLVIGTAAAVVLTRGLQAVLFGVSPVDPASLSVAVLLVASTGLAAAWWPARNAARVDPVVAIREE